MALALSDLWVLLSVGSALITPAHSEVRRNCHLDFMEFFGVVISARLLETTGAKQTCLSPRARPAPPVDAGLVAGHGLAHTHTHTALPWPQAAQAVGATRHPRLADEPTEVARG